LYSKIIQGTEVIEGKTEDTMKGKFEADEIVKNSTTNHHIEYWYGKHLLSFGVQDLKNVTTPYVPMNRKVFFINKITFQE
jgi:hypothetical protein